VFVCIVVAARIVSYVRVLFAEASMRLQHFLKPHTWLMQFVFSIEWEEENE